MINKKISLKDITNFGLGALISLFVTWPIMEFFGDFALLLIVVIATAYIVYSKKPYASLIGFVGVVFLIWSLVRELNN